MGQESINEIIINPFIKTSLIMYGGFIVGYYFIGAAFIDGRGEEVALNWGVRSALLSGVFFCSGVVSLFSEDLNHTYGVSFLLSSIIFGNSIRGFYNFNKIQKDKHDNQR